MRGEAGLSYDIGSVFEADALDRSALFAVYGMTNPANVGKVESLVVEEVRKFLADGPGAEELEAGKKAYLDLLRSARADDGRLAGQLAERLYLGRTFRHAAEFERKVEALTPAGVRQAFGTVVDPKRLVVIKAGDFKTK